MKPGFYKHKRSMDLVFQVISTYDYGFAPAMTCMGYWWNLGWSGTPWTIDYDAITIKTENIGDWEYMGETCPKRTL